jgi:DMSO reductase family type II enzyme chaperone
MYQLLSQTLAYPTQETVDALVEVDLPQAQQAATEHSRDLAPLLTVLGEHLRYTDADGLQVEHRRVFSHILSLDCPPCETFYTACDVFQETQEMADIAGFFHAFGLEMADRERLDHISVELEFMHFLVFKEAYALTHHGPDKARLCRDTQRKFMQDHLGRWAPQFARRLGEKAGGGFFQCVASLVEAFVEAEVDFLKARPETAAVSADWRKTSPEEFQCPAAEACP